MKPSARTARSSSKSRTSSPNKSLQRAGTHKVLGRGRSSLFLISLPRARVLLAQRAVAELGRYATEPLRTL